MIDHDSSRHLAWSTRNFPVLDDDPATWDLATSDIRQVTSLGPMGSGGFHKWYPNSWMVYLLEIPSING